MLMMLHLVSAGLAADACGVWKMMLMMFAGNCFVREAFGSSCSQCSLVATWSVKGLAADVHDAGWKRASPCWVWQLMLMMLAGGGLSVQGCHTLHRPGRVQWRLKSSRRQNPADPLPNPAQSGRLQRASAADDASSEHHENHLPNPAQTRT